MRNEKGKGAFIRLESSGCPVLGAYVWYFYTTVKRLPSTSKYNSAVNPKSSVRPCTFEHTFVYYSQSKAYYLSA
jgi:hypothetical protein